MQPVVYKHILQSKGAVLSEQISGVIKYVDSGLLNIYLSQNQLLLKINEFGYRVDKGIIITYDDTDSQYQRVFYLKQNPNKIWILQINDNADIIEQLFREHCYRRSQTNSETGQREGFQQKSVDKVQRKRKEMKTKKIRKDSKNFKKFKDLTREQEVEQQQLPEQKQQANNKMGLSSLFKFGGKLLSVGVKLFNIINGQADPPKPPQ